MLLYLTCLLAAASVPQTKLNGPLTTQVFGAVKAFEFAPDGAHLVYVSDERLDEVHELFSVPADGSSAPVRLSGDLVAGGDVVTAAGAFEGAFAFAPDGTWVAFLADATSDGVFELWRVPIDGSASPLLLSGSLVGGGDVESFRISGDGTTVVFLADALVDAQTELFRVPSDASAPRQRLSSTLVSGGDVSAYELGAQSARAYYLADAALDGVVELFSVPLDLGTAAQRLNDVLPAGRTVLDFRVAPDESRVAYRADGTTDEVFELFSVPADRSAPPVTLNATPVFGGDVGSEYILGGSRVFYLGDLELNDVLELFSAPLDGSTASVKLHPSSSSVLEYAVTPAGNDVLFSGAVGPERGLFRVPAAGGTPVRIEAAASNEYLYSLRIDPTGSRCLLVRNVTEHTIGGDVIHEELWAVHLDGSASELAEWVYVGAAGLPSPQWSADLSRIFYARATLADPLLTSVTTDGSTVRHTLAIVRNFRFSPVDSRVALVGGGGIEDEGRLVTIASDGSDPKRLSGPTRQGDVVGDVSTVHATADELQAVHATTGPSAVHVVGVGGASLSKVVLDPLFPQDLRTLASSPDGKTLAFSMLASPINFNVDQILYLAPLRGPSAPVRVQVPSGAQASTSLKHTPAFSPDSSELLFALTTQVLMVTDRDGILPPRRISGMATDGALWSDQFDAAPGRAFEWTADGLRVLYAARSAGSTFDLFSAPIDGSTPSAQLSSLKSLDLRDNWEVMPDGLYVLFRGDQLRLGVVELLYTKLDGSTTAVRLNGSLTTGGSLGPMDQPMSDYVRVTPDGSRVVYLADQNQDEVWALYSRPPDRSLQPARISGPLLSTMDVLATFQLSPDGTRALYRADALIDDTFELFSAPVNGSAAPVKLSHTLSPGSDVTATQGREGLVKFGQGRVVYAATEASTGGTVELFSVPLDGSAAPVRISAPMVTGGNVQLDTILVTADGGTVLYRADQETDEVFELWRVPIDGSAAPVRVNLPLPAGGDVQPDVRLLENGNRILYRADQEVDERFELYTLRLAPRTPRGPASSAAPTGTATRQL